MKKCSAVFIAFLLVRSAYSCEDHLIPDRHPEIVTILARTPLPKLWYETIA